ncbi:MAG: ankyrin repeat domain-containing protein [Bdellovibrionaceae bacterium]|nr:ankyrin repeat domain-containing protein [Pseudobdellovibrionaceae bacterium]
MTKLFLILMLGFSPLVFAKKAVPDLFAAAESGDLATLKNHKSALKEKNSAGESLLIKAVSAGQMETAKWLIRNGADVNEADLSGGTALLYAVSGGEEELALLLIEKGADLEKTYGERKESVVFEAVRLGQNKVLEKILTKSPKLAQGANTEGETALFEAVRSAQSKSAQILLKKGADKAVRNKKGRKAVDLADPKTDSALIQILN